jgi:hypothetical protein
MISVLIGPDTPVNSWSRKLAEEALPMWGMPCAQCGEICGKPFACETGKRWYYGEGLGAG